MQVVVNHGYKLHFSGIKVGTIFEKDDAIFIKTHNSSAVCLHCDTESSSYYEAGSSYSIGKDVKVLIVRKVIYDFVGGN